jgi:hypothetical protein
MQMKTNAAEKKCAQDKKIDRTYIYQRLAQRELLRTIKQLSTKKSTPEKRQNYLEV